MADTFAEKGSPSTPSALNESTSRGQLRLLCPSKRPQIWPPTRAGRWPWRDGELRPNSPERILRGASGLSDMGSESLQRRRGEASTSLERRTTVGIDWVALLGDPAVGPCFLSLGLAGLMYFLPSLRLCFGDLSASLHVWYVALSFLAAPRPTWFFYVLM